MDAVGATEMCAGSQFGEIKARLIDLEAVPLEITRSWRFEELRRRQAQIVVVQLKNRDKDSTENLTLY